MLSAPDAPPPPPAMPRRADGSGSLRPAQVAAVEPSGVLALPSTGELVALGADVQLLLGCVAADDTGALITEYERR